MCCVCASDFLAVLPPAVFWVEIGVMSACGVLYIMEPQKAIIYFVVIAITPSVVRIKGPRPTKALFLLNLFLYQCTRKKYVLY